MRGGGGGALGFQQTQDRWQDIDGGFAVLGGIDSDPLACADFEALTGVPEANLDLFDERDYEAWHGHTPPQDWRPATPENIRRAAQGRAPDVVFGSPPCKGYSGLLPQASSDSDRYQALNRLVIRGIVLTLEAWRDDPPAVIMIENVPRITTRGVEHLRQVVAVLESYGYAIHQGYHDCGELGGLGQHRRRYLLIARHLRKAPALVYKPPVQKVRTIGEVLGPMPMPWFPATAVTVRHALVGATAGLGLESPLQALEIARVFVADDVRVLPDATPELIREVVRRTRAQTDWQTVVAGRVKWRPQWLLSMSDPAQGHDGGLYRGAGAEYLRRLRGGKDLWGWPLGEAVRSSGSPDSGRAGRIGAPAVGAARGRIHGADAERSLHAGYHRRQVGRRL